MINVIKVFSVRSSNFVSEILNCFRNEVTVFAIIEYMVGWPFFDTTWASRISFNYLVQFIYGNILLKSTSMRL